MPIHALRNQYRGINAHLHSLWQSQGGWAEFHSRHIVYLAEALQTQLTPLGYIAAVEPSLQIRRIDDGTVQRVPEPDVSIHDRNATRSAQPRSGAAFVGVGELVMPILEALRDDTLSERDYSVVKLYRLEDNKVNRGEPVAWIELLSPSNKPGGRDAANYEDKRLEVVQSGVVFVELDYLHASPPTIHQLPVYRVRQGKTPDAAAYPYRIVIVDPRPEMADGVLRVHEFDVDSAIPTMTIPLSGDDLLDFDFDAPYQRTFEAATYGVYLVDYAQLPMEFERYTPADQTRIARRMLAVMEAVRDGLDLATVSVPLAVKDMPLDEALEAIRHLQPS